MTDDLDEFFNEIEEDIVETQKEIAHFAMENLFEYSPHFSVSYRFSEKDHGGLEQIRYEIKQEKINKLIQLDKIMDNGEITLYEYKKRYKEIILSLKKKFDQKSELFYQNLYGDHDSGSKYSTSEYDANHSVFIDTSYNFGRNPATFNPKISKMIHDLEAQKIESIDEIGHTITINNTVGHAKDVETGLLWERRDGYFPYLTTEGIIDSKYADDVQKTFSNMDETYSQVMSKKGI